MTFALVLGEHDYAAIREQRRHAETPAHFYTDAKQSAGLLPDHDPRFVVRLGLPPVGEVRAVYTITVASDGRAYRHLSITAKQWGRAGTPSPSIVEWIARECYGFTGGVGDWIVDFHEHVACGGQIAVLQRFMVN